MWDFPLIQTNFWDGVAAVPIILAFTQLFKILVRVPRHYVPSVALISGLAVSLFFSHPHNFWGALFMGYFYGYGAIGSYSSLKCSLQALRKDKHIYSSKR
ncbi:hypothetical protein [Peribacillus kribbensis]|uniref:hypothetical protein n=1 Tax=Peribacillus kribbensis TaxID=356658 RepID=UPI00041F9B0A|nr:hypothetical protein [Peribacillus kribbensis]